MKRSSWACILVALSTVPTQDLLKTDTGQKTTERLLWGLCLGFSSLGKLSSVMDRNSKPPKAVPMLGRFSELGFVPTMHEAPAESRSSRWGVGVGVLLLRQQAPHPFILNPSSLCWQKVWITVGL